ncbi:tRNA synthetases class I (C) catalytic domain protein [Mycobacterium xenopi 4042]|uniref:tRNA synthetases class I (C) catalytic domain protein n=1 Tax=Mycobacterium xenopi 4042 TaxID=1299334 RepID=X8BGA4_MYCXE|nr:tRNA synthetases class I (C) catalytic domain protein [Mycobacterium xenopi 4042]
MARPAGWHVECAAIALSRIGTGLDIQGGGNDLIFPHHEFTAAHAECVSGSADSLATMCMPG